jgi:hypothetical protein
MRTGELIKKVPTPFHDGIELADPLQVRDLGDCTMCGKDGRWFIAFTDDCALHSVDTQTGEHRLEWKFEYKPVKQGTVVAEGKGFRAVIDGEPEPSGVPVVLRGGTKVIISGLFGDNGFGKVADKVHLWDQAARKMDVLEKIPPQQWQAGWGDLAWSNWYEESLWNLATRKWIRLPKSEQRAEEMEMDSRQRTLFVLREGGGVDVFRIENGETAKPIARLVSPVSVPLSYVNIVMTADDQHLVWQGEREVQFDENNKRIVNEQAVVARFDVGDLTK